MWSRLVIAAMVLLLSGGCGGCRKEPAGGGATEGDSAQGTEPGKSPAEAQGVSHAYETVKSGTVDLVGPPSGPATTARRAAFDGRVPPRFP